nr:hypothetical protein [uncultured Rhodoferax sp.]
MTKKRVHILSAVNAANVSKSGGVYTIKNMCGAVDGIVMNSRMYPADQLAKGVATLEGKPAPAGHPKNDKGQHISALNGDALLTSYIGAICRNARHEAGRTLVDVVVNEAQAKAHADGAKLVERLDAALNGTNAEPIHVSTGLLLDEVVANGESLGKKYTSIATNLQYDHIAILLNESGAGTPEQGVGLFLNSAGEAEPVEVVNLELKPEDKRFTGLAGWIRKLLGNSDMSFEQIADGLRGLVPKEAWVREVFPKYFVWVDYTSDKLYRQDYALASDGSLALIGDPIEVIRKVEYEPIVNQEKEDTVKTHILAALNAAGIAVAGLDDTQLLTAYNSLIVKPTEEKLIAANSKIAGFEAEKHAAVDAELTTLATALAVNSSLSVDDLKKLGVERLKELSAKAAPVVVSNSGTPAAPANEFAGYDLNATLGA